MVPSGGHPDTSRFRTTHWSAVVAAAGSGASSREALEQLCRTYWRPIHDFIRNRGHGNDEARDLTQGFFAGFLERGDVERVHPSRGRFRAYLLAAVQHFLSNERERERALKRGGAVELVSIDVEGAGVFEPRDDRTPERRFEREWALALLRRVLERLRAEQVDAGREDLFERLKPLLVGGEIAGGFAALAAEAGSTEAALRVAAHRLKKRYGQLLTEEVARTVDVPQDVEDELRYLLRALRG